MSSAWNSGTSAKGTLFQTWLSYGLAGYMGHPQRKTVHVWNTAGNVSSGQLGNKGCNAKEMELRWNVFNQTVREKEMVGITFQKEAHGFLMDFINAFKVNTSICFPSVIREVTQLIQTRTWEQRVTQDTCQNSLKSLQICSHAHKPIPHTIAWQCRISHTCQEQYCISFLLPR